MHFRTAAVRVLEGKRWYTPGSNWRQFIKGVFIGAREGSRPRRAGAASRGWYCWGGLQGRRGPLVGVLLEGGSPRPQRLCKEEVRASISPTSLPLLPITVPPPRLSRQKPAVEGRSSGWPGSLLEHRAGWGRVERGSGEEPMENVQTSGAGCPFWSLCCFTDPAGIKNSTMEGPRDPVSLGHHGFLELGTTLVHNMCPINAWWTWNMWINAWMNELQISLSSSWSFYQRKPLVESCRCPYRAKRKS